jgi:hypothetical protein
VEDFENAEGCRRIILGSKDPPRDQTEESDDISIAPSEVKNCLMDMFSHCVS